MKIYELNITQRIDAPLEKVFDLIQQCENGKKISSILKTTESIMGLPRLN